MCMARRKSDDSVSRIVSGRHDDPFSFLGMHRGAKGTLVVRTFQPGGRVFTREPESGPKDARCEKTLPNGLPLCETYRVRGGTIAIGDAKPVPFARVKQGLRIDGDLYRPVALPKGLRLAGRYESTSFISAGGQQGGIVLQRAFTFTGDRFVREGFAGASLVSTDTGTPFGDPVAGITTASASSNQGSYRFPSPGTIELRYDDGTRERLFFFLPDGPGASPKAIHVGGDDYLRTTGQDRGLAAGQARNPRRGRGGRLARGG